MSKFATFLPARSRQYLLAAGAVGALFLSGCQNYTQQSADMTEAWRTGQLQVAVDEVNKKASDRSDSRDALVWKLEQGSILRAASLADLPAPVGAAPAMGTPDGEQPPARTTVLTKESLAALDFAEEKVNYWEEQAKVKVASEAGALLTNQATLPYRGHAYDKVMMNTYKALNYLALGERDNARVELNRALQRQKDAVAENAKRLEAAQEDAKAAKKDGASQNGATASYDVEKAQKDPQTSAALAQVENELSTQLRAYGDYVNPFSVFLDGLFFLAQGEGGSDLERARKSIERVAAMVPDNAYLQTEHQIAEAAANGKALEPTTYVFFETGSAPHRKQIRIDIPTFIVTDRVSYVGAAFPRLEFNDDFASSLSVSAAGQSLDTALLCSMDSVIAQDFKNEWPTIITKTLISTGLRATLDAVVQNQVKDQGWQAQLAAKIAMVAYQAATNIADTRTWTTLPKQFQYCRLATPSDRQLTLTSGTQSQTITLEPGKINVVYVKSVSSNSPLWVSQFILQ
jgi:hypothetical protein